MPEKQDKETVEKMAMDILSELGIDKEAFVPAPGGNMEDPAMAGGMPPPPMDPGMGGMPPPPGDPAAGGMPPPPMDPGMGGMPPPPGDPGMGGMPPGGQEDEMAILYSMIEDVVQNVLTQQGIIGGEAGAAAPAAAEEKKVTNDAIMEKLDEMSTRIEALESGIGAPDADVMGDIASPAGVGPLAPGAGPVMEEAALEGSKLAEDMSKNASLCDRIKKLRRI